MGQELYRMHQQGPVQAENGCSKYCVPVVFQTDVMSTDPSKPMRIVGHSKMNFKRECFNPCGSPFSDVEVVNRETGASFTIAQAPYHLACCRSPCAEGDFTLPITMSNGQ